MMKLGVVSAILPTLTFEHLDEGGIPRAKEFVDGVLKNAGV
ncbi:hypothetical protein [Candidatus Allofournierella excrementavium]